MSAEVHDVLVKARNLIADPKRWTSGSFAKDAQGRRVPPKSPEACRWCAVGAAIRVDEDTDDVLAGRAVGALQHLLGNESVAYTNDSSRHADVLALFDRAIKATKP